MDSLTGRLHLFTRSQFWAILPDRLPWLTSVLVHGSILGSDWEAAKPSIQGKGPNKVAVIPVQGVLSKDGPGWLGSNYDAITDAAEKAAADPSVKRVVLAVDSPGGEVTGLQETASVLAQVAKVKPVSSIVEGMAASAAYWLASQSSDITLTPSGEVGSVGVRMMHADISKMLEDQGIKVTELYSGNLKTEWSPFKALSEDAIGDMQTRLAATHTDFLNAVQSGRGDRVSAEMKGNRMGEGRMFGADAAASHGLVDKIQAPREFYRSIVPVEEDPKSPVFGFQNPRAVLEVFKSKNE